MIYYKLLGVLPNFYVDGRPKIVISVLLFIFCSGETSHDSLKYPTVLRKLRGSSEKLCSFDFDNGVFLLFWWTLVDNADLSNPSEAFFCNFEIEFNQTLHSIWAKFYHFLKYFFSRNKINLQNRRLWIERQANNWIPFLETKNRLRTQSENEWSWKWLSL